MRIERIELRLLRLPLVRFFETSFGRIYDRPFLLVTLEDDGAAGIGECVADANPFYSAETTRTAWHIISEFITPLVLGREFTHPREIYPALDGIREPSPKRRLSNSTAATSHPGLILILIRLYPAARSTATRSASSSSES